MYILLSYIFCGLVQISLGSTSNEATHYHKILKSLNNATEFNVKALDLLLEKLNLEHCKSHHNGGKPCSQKCGPPEHIFETHGFGNNLTATEFSKLSTTLLYYLLPEKNAGLNICVNGDDAHVSTYERLLKYYKTTGNICVRFLNRILRDVKERVRKSQAIQKPCFSAEGIFREIGVSPKTSEIDKTQFSNMSIVIISYLSNGHCLEVHNEEDLPCKSYFTSDILQHFGGEENKISFEGFKEILETIGVGNVTDHHSNEGNEHDHGHDKLPRREKRNLPSRVPFQIKQCYSADDLAIIFAVDKSDGLDSKKFMEICPAMIQQLESGICKPKPEKIGSTHNFTHEDDDSKLLMIFIPIIIVLLSLIIVTLFKSMKHKRQAKSTYIMSNKRYNSRSNIVNISSPMSLPNNEITNNGNFETIQEGEEPATPEESNESEAFDL